MRLAEQKLWDRIKNNAPSGTWLQRIENLVFNGMPDAYIADKDHESMWFELKWCKKPVRRTSCLIHSKDMRIEQKNWHVKAATMGVKSYIIIGSDDKSVYIIPGALAYTVHEMDMIMLEEYRTTSWPDFWRKIYEN